MCSTTLSETTPVAKKQHKCDWCGELIMIGEKYNYWSGIFDGDFGTTKLHLVCHKAFMDSEINCDEGFSHYEQKKGKVYGYEE